MDKIITVEELAQKLSIEKRETIYQWVHKRVIPFIKINGKLRFSERDIEVWIEQSKYCSGEQSLAKEEKRIYEKIRN